MRQAADGVALKEIDLQISAAEKEGPALEKLRAKRQQKVKSIADTNGQLAVSMGWYDCAVQPTAPFGPQRCCRSLKVHRSFALYFYGYSY